MNLLFKKNLMPTTRNANGELLLACPVCGDSYVRISAVYPKILELRCEQGHFWRYGFHFHKGETMISLEAWDIHETPAT